jgi:hypothetical protein
MRSESLVRLDAEPARQFNNEQLRQELAAQVNEYLARGGAIQTIPSHVAVRPTLRFDLGPTSDRTRAFQYGRGR